MIHKPIQTITIVATWQAISISSSSWQQLESWRVGAGCVAMCASKENAPIKLCCNGAACCHLHARQAVKLPPYHQVVDKHLLVDLHGFHVRHAGDLAIIIWTVGATVPVLATLSGCLIQLAASDIVTAGLHRNVLICSACQANSMLMQLVPLKLCCRKWCRHRSAQSVSG